MAREQITMLDAAVDAAPDEKQTAGKDYVFLLLFEQRQGAICFAAVAAGAVHGKRVGIVFAPFWAVVAFLDWWGFAQL